MFLFWARPGSEPKPAARNRDTERAETAALSFIANRRQITI
jgi:hypothetical protein